MQARVTVLIVLSLSFFILHSPNIQAQSYIIKGKVVDEDDYPVSYATVALLSRTDSAHLAGGLTDENGEYSITCDSARVIGRISYIGMQTSYQSLEKGRPVTSILRMDTRELEEVVVEGDRTYRLKRTATGEIYYLSKYAKNSKDPFKALQEIPRLQVNRLEQSVKTADNNSLLILIDGQSVNSGIAPIDPKDIESVEIMDVTTARYLQSGINKILNIKLKRKRSPYQWYQFETSHFLPVEQGNIRGYFEVGSPVFSLYGNTSLMYTHGKEWNQSEYQSIGGASKNSVYRNRDDSFTPHGVLMGKWNINKRNYFAAKVEGHYSRQEIENNGTGTLTYNSPMPYTLTTENLKQYYILTASSYFKHEFTERKVLEMELNYNYNGDKTEGEREELFNQSQGGQDLYSFKYKNRRTSATLEIDYSSRWGNSNSLNLGCSTQLTDDHVDKITDQFPLFVHRKWNEYVYASFSSMWKQIRYMVSGGLQGMWLKSGEVDSHYFRPHVSISGSYTSSSLHAIRLSYQLSNNSPLTAQLNPYNISTDPLVVIKGNPDLKPEVKQNISLNYSLYRKSFYIGYGMGYTFSTDVVESYGYVNDSVFVRSFRNSGHYGSLRLAEPFIMYSLPNGTGQISLSGSHVIDYFKDMNAKHRNEVSLLVNLTFGKWSFFGNLMFNDYKYSPLTKTKYSTPTLSLLQVGYEATPNLYVGISSMWLCGNKMETSTEVEGFSSLVKSSKVNSWSPFFTLRYTIRKNPKRKIRLDNVLQSSEKGIEL